MTNRNEHLKRYFRRYWRMFAIGGVFLVATNWLALEIPRELGEAVEQVRIALESSGDAANRAFSRVGSLFWIIVALAVGAALTRILSRIFIFNAGRQIEFDLRNEVFDNLLRLDSGFYRGSSTGDLVSRIANDVNYVRVLFGFGFLNVVNAIVSGGIALSKMVAVDPRLTLISLAPYPLVFLVVGSVTRAMYRYTQQSQEALSDVTTKVQENLAGIAVVKTFAIERRQAGRFADLSARYLDRNLKLALVRGMLMPFMGTIAGLGMLVLLYFGGLRVIEGGLDVGQFVEFSGYIAVLTWPTIALGWVLTVWHRGLASFDRLVEILDAEPAIQSPPSEDARLPDGPGLVMRDVTYHYPEDDRPAVESIDLTVQAGERVALVGRTGSGKTTVIRLAARLLDPTEGHVTLGGCDLRVIDVDELRARIGLVPQDAFLFSTTLRGNIAFGLRALVEHGRPLPGPVLDGVDGDGESEQRAISPTLSSGQHLTTVSDDEGDAQFEQHVRAAAHAAALDDDLVALPRGLDTVVGERGVTLSGGQKQRSALARGIAVAPDMLLLDDTLSAVDNETERRILDALSEVMAGRTAIIATHRYHLLELVDRIYVLDEGRVVEAGTHAELLARDGLYADLYERQLLEEEFSHLDAGGGP